MEEDHPNNACSGWDNSSCEGTPYCPPRCPKFFDTHGEPLYVRSITEDDFEPLVNMYQSMSPAQQTMGLPPITRTATEAWISTLINEGWNLLAVLRDQIVGHVGVAPADHARPEFVLFVDHRYQGRGIGSELVKQMIAHAQNRGHEALLLDAASDNPRAIELYRNVGFQRIDESGTNPVRFAHVEMACSFPNEFAEKFQRPPAER